MKYPPDHYPPTPIQHTRALAALTLTKVCTEIYKFDEKLKPDLAKLSGHACLCGRALRRKYQSAGQRRDLDNCLCVLEPYIDKAMLDFRSWCCLFCAALDYVRDAVATCPVYSQNEDRNKWGKLYDVMEAMANSLCIAEPKTDNIGTVTCSLESMPLKS